MPDFTQYQPPGVYISEDSSPIQQVVGVSPSVVAIVGPSVGYRTFSEAISLVGTTPTPLGKTGVDLSSLVVKSAAGVPFAVTSDYLTAVTGGADTLTGTPQDNVTTLARSGGGSQILDGSTVYVSYHYTDTAYFTPLRVQDYDDAKDAFGQPFDPSTGAIVSPISLAAQFAFANGAATVVLIPTAGGSTHAAVSDLDTAYGQLASLYDVNVVVPLPVGLTGSDASPGDLVNVGASLRTHLEHDATADSIFRIGVIGYENTVTINPLTIAAGIRSKRVLLAWPNRLNYFNGLINQSVELPGYYLAAAMAGRIAALPVDLPLTKKQIVGFSSIPAVVLNAMTTTTKNAWSDGGIAVAEVSRDRRLLVRHGTSTDRSTIYTREVSLVRAKDALVRLIQDTVEASDLIGSPIVDETTVRVKGMIQGCLETAQASTVIVGYSNLKVRQASVDPSVIEVKFAYKPAYPLNYVVVSFSVDTATGNIQDLAA